MFKKISEAYAVLSNPKRKKRYDMFGETGNEEDGLDDMFGEMDDMFSFMFGRGGAGGMGSMDDDFESFIDMLA